MRIATWNCQSGECRARAEMLFRLGADIVVLQECTRPTPTDDQCQYFPTVPSKGVGIITKGPWRVATADLNGAVSDTAYPVAITGPQQFHALAVWAQKSPTYVRAILGALDHYGAFLKAAPSIIVGDFNSHQRWDRDDRNANHSSLVKRLEEEFGLVSAFHTIAERDRRPEPPTYFHLRKEDRPYHIDYCFVPKTWVPRLRSVEVGNFADWASESDHRPLVVEIDESQQ